ncbi:hypothetical protein LshimejAT787_0406400 [Lyophyllum shimeji]|uniref:Uncharacterized protein n=1 Tax=Lyophyllum shimeji TaxID=47721 RepID=A0A9P3PLF9_LYOSH|nr:hypothetical protein LshimejAT787_0406400 [Lyophyllum shimeji]
MTNLSVPNRGSRSFTTSASPSSKISQSEHGHSVVNDALGATSEKRPHCLQIWTTISTILSHNDEITQAWISQPFS